VFHARVRITVVKEASNQIPIVVVDVHVDVSRERGVAAISDRAGLRGHSIASILDAMRIVVGDGNDRENIRILFVVSVAKVANGILITGQAVDDLIVIG